MKIIELLAGQLNREALPHEINAAQQIFTQSLEFWSLCLEARRLLLEEKGLTNDKNKLG